MSEEQVIAELIGRAEKAKAELRGLESNAIFLSQSYEVLAHALAMSATKAPGLEEALQKYLPVDDLRKLFADLRAAQDSVYGLNRELTKYGVTLND